jgi:hypothetical protein
MGVTAKLILTIVAAPILLLIVVWTIGVDLGNRVELNHAEREAGVTPSTQPAVDVDDITPVE